MNFFVPHARSAAEAEAEEVWDATRYFLIEQGYCLKSRPAEEPDWIVSATLCLVLEPSP